MFRIIFEDNKYKIKGFSASSTDIPTISSLSILVSKYPNLASTSYVINVDTDECYTFNQDTQTWRLQS